MHGIAEALYFAAVNEHFQRNPAEVERLASELVELSTRQNFALWLIAGRCFVVGRAALPVTQPKVSRGSKRRTRLSSNRWDAEPDILPCTKG